MALSNVQTLQRLRPARAKLAQKNRAISASLSAPVGGWNVRDSIAAMDPLDAVSIINYFPGTTSVMLRSGYTQFSTGLPGQVETVFSYSGSTTTKLFAASGSAIYDCTSGGAVGAASYSGLTNVRWQYVNIATSGGNYIVAVNGADTPLTFDGTTWATTSITGLTSTQLITVELHKNRLWFAQVGTLKAWYLPTQSIAGAAAALDLSAFAPHGGYIMSIGTWTIDAGYGVDDLIVFVTSNGDVIVYRGTDPSSASTWAHVGVWWIGSPVGRRCLMKYNGDLLIICQDGLIPMSSLLQSSRTNPKVALTDKIQYQVSQSITNYGTNFGWQLQLFPKQNMLLLNVPVATGSQEQYAMNTITKAWCDLTGWAANCWTLYNDNIYFGGNTIVGKAWNTNSDNGGAIAGSFLQAFNYFGSPGQLKRFTMMRPTMYLNGTPSLQGSINVDFETAAPTSNLSVPALVGGVWDTAIWDSALWGDVQPVSRLWQGAFGVGYCGAPRFASTSTGVQILYLSTDVVFEPGGII